MHVTFQKAKNGEDTALIENLYLHSAYNPNKEAERFVENLTCPFTPKIVIITEPALSYTSYYLRKRFSSCKIGVIRYVPDFNQYNSLFDFALNYYDHKNDFSTFLSSFLNEESLLCTYFCSWEPSSKAFSEINQTVWKEIKISLENAKTLLITRQYFEKKWLINSFNFFCNITNLKVLKNKSQLPVFIIASGPSLNDFLPEIHKNQNNFFIIALSSAIRVCLQNYITPDLCLSTDGGYWAGQHLKILKNKNLILGITPESFCQKSILRNGNILPLEYDDGISKKLYEITKIPSVKLKRNGTVSGSALEFVLENFSEEVFFFGLDLSSSKGFQHAQNNELEINNSINDFLLNSKEKRSFRSEISCQNLEIYKQWFKNFNLKGRKVYRVINSKYKHNSLGQISDINYQAFCNLIKNHKAVNKINLFYNADFKMNNEKLKDFLKNDFFAPSVKRQLYPLDYILLSHEKNNKEVIERIEKNHKNLYEKLRKIADDRHNI